ncbi:hypothetical protein EST38_g12332 [Candolleomyces aberdarensis]|uniref:Uncharacterized protein n=1 Tax=Candolleomyces aberdarensis TaxID=2316362 RepID=A0A4Q2D4Y6_9AGAR|nr:hypothetical protein EST38_g12332 [Candolleomyces aberdarensis]
MDPEQVTSGGSLPTIFERPHTADGDFHESELLNRSGSAPPVFSHFPYEPPLPAHPSPVIKPPQESAITNEGPSPPEPLTVIGQSEEMAEVNPYAEKGLYKLRPMDYPLHVYKETPGEYNRVKLRIPTLQPPHTFGKDPSRKDVQERYQELVQLGLDAIGQPEKIVDRNLSRGERIMYKSELTLLDLLLTEVYQYTSPEEERAYSIKPRLYGKLKELLKRAEDAVHRQDPLLSPNDLPDLPAWGPYNRELQYWSPVDFEIIGVNFRLQVENFLKTLADRIYARDKEDPKKPKEKGKEREGIQPPSSNQQAGEPLLEGDMRIFLLTPPLELLSNKEFKKKNLYLVEQ